LVLTDDIVLALAAAVTTATVIVLSVVLLRYRAVVEDAGKSAQLAKNLWDSMNSRLQVQDARIIDLMAKVEVYSVRKAHVQPQKPVTAQSQAPQPTLRVADMPSAAGPLPSSSAEPTPEMDGRILTALASGPKSSREIKDIIGKSREHTARLMKVLFEKGMVVRNDRNKPYVYEITESGRNYLNRVV
jgi:hypothetical protein